MSANVPATPRDPAQEARTRRALQQQALLLNSLLQRGEFIQTSSSSFTSITAQTILANQIFGP